MPFRRLAVLLFLALPLTLAAGVVTVETALPGPVYKVNGKTVEQPDLPRVLRNAKARDGQMTLVICWQDRTEPGKLVFLFESLQQLNVKTVRFQQGAAAGKAEPEYGVTTKELVSPADGQAQHARRYEEFIKELQEKMPQFLRGQIITKTDTPDAAKFKHEQQETAKSILVKYQDLKDTKLYKKLAREFGSAPE